MTPPATLCGLHDIVPDRGADARFRTDDGETIFDTVDEARDNHEELVALLAEYGIVRDGE